MIALGTLAACAVVVWRVLLTSHHAAADIDALAAIAKQKLSGDDASASEQALTRWCEAAPRDPLAHRLRMDLRHRTGRAKRGDAERLRWLALALADGQHVLHLDPANDAVRREVTWLLLNLGRFDEAERLCRTSLAAAPDDPWLKYLLAKVHHGQGRGNEAEKLLDPIVRDQPGFVEALLLRAMLHREAAQPARAIPLLRQALAQARGPRKECQHQLALALASAGHNEEALRLLAELQLAGLQDAVERDSFPRTPAMHVQIAEAMLASGRADEARKLLEEVLADAPDFAPARMLLGQIK